MSKNFLFWVILYLVFAVASNQSITRLTKNKKNASALAVLLELSAGITILILSPFYSFSFPTNPIVYVLLGVACIFYAISDRMNITVRSGVDPSVFALIGKTSTFYMIILGFLFFKEQFIIKKFIGAMLIIISNVIIFYKKGRFHFNKYLLFGLISKLLYTCALFFDVNISNNFNLPFYVSLTLIVPAILILIVGRIKPKHIVDEFKNSSKTLYIISTISWGVPPLCALSAYQLGEVSIIAPLLALTAVLNVFVDYIFYKEKDNLIQKIIASILVIISIILIK